MISPTFVVLHLGQSISMAEYFFRVLVYLLTFAGFGATVFGAVRIIDAIRSYAGNRRSDTSDTER